MVKMSRSSDKRLSAVPGVMETRGWLRNGFPFLSTSGVTLVGRLALDEREMGVTFDEGAGGGEAGMTSSSSSTDKAGEFA